ncbi:hrcA [Acrasis kona]|uniref:HrcA n=1 Tax=Acrasis kona TaxID=1008807 RepID=A0AAW2Z8F0_9EUKA
MLATDYHFDTRRAIYDPVPSPMTPSYEFESIMASKSTKSKRSSLLSPATPTAWFENNDYRLTVSQRIIILSLTKSGFLKPSIANLEATVAWAVLCDLIINNKVYTFQCTSKKKLNKTKYCLCITDSHPVDDPAQNLMLQCIQEAIKKDSKRAIRHIIREICSAGFGKRILDSNIHLLTSMRILKIRKDIKLGFFSLGAFPIQKLETKAEIRRQLNESLNGHTTSDMYALACLLKCHNMLEKEVAKFEGCNKPAMKNTCNNLLIMKGSGLNSSEQVICSHLGHVMSELQNRR